MRWAYGEARHLAWHVREFLRGLLRGGQGERKDA